MTVLYTTNLALGQPVTGTESGTWGDDVNNAVTSYLDIAISGSLALTSASFTANALTLANTQGTSSATNIGATTAQYYVLRLSSLAANVTITAPSVSKTYLVVNADATYSATIKASGQTGVSIAPGERATVYFNGTDYIRVTSSVVSNLTGTLPVANGGTGSTTAQTALNTLAGGVTSGFYLRGNGANIALVTIQAADVPTLNQNTTGTAAGLSATLAVASGGTGLTSTPANGALDIGNGTGFTRTTLTAGTGVSITNTSGAITVANTGVTSVTGTAPVVSSGGATPAISMAAATTSVNGYLTSTDWTTFNGKQAALVSGTNIKTVNSTSLLGSGDVSVGVTSVTGTAPVVSSGGATPAISMAAASTSTNGYLTSTDWNTFNGKGSGTVTSVTGTAPVVSSGGATPAISMAAASTSVSGYLTSTDWNTFNGKQAAGSYVTVGGALGTPSSGVATNLTGTASGLSIGGNAATATTATNATNLATANYSIVQAGANLVFKYGSTSIASLDPSGNLIVLGNVTAYGTP
jgi:hypothetical protein